MKLKFTLVMFLDEGNGVGKRKQTAVRQMEDWINVFSIQSNVFLLGGWLIQVIWNNFK